MSGPWEQYAAQAQSNAPPWELYKAQAAAPDALTTIDRGIQRSTQNILNAFGYGFHQGVGEQPFTQPEDALNPDTVKFLKDAGVFHDYSKGMGNYWQDVFEGVIRHGAAALEEATRLGTGVIAAPLQAAGQALEETGIVGKGQATGEEGLAGAASDMGAMLALGPLGEMSAFRAAQRASDMAKLQTDLSRARSLGVIGEGEAGFHDAVPVTPENQAARAEAAKETGVPATEPLSPPADVHELAHRIEPEAIDKLQSLQADKDEARADLAAISAKEATSPELVDTRGLGVQYHGSKAPIEELGEGYYNENNIYGATGFYTTDAQDIARGYQRKSPTGTLYRVSEKEPVRFFDMETSQSPDEWRTMFPHLADDDLFQTALESTGERPNLREIMDEMRAESSNFGLSKDSVHEIFGMMQSQLADNGYGGMRHVGGLKTKKQPHNVQIYFRPDTQISLEKTELQYEPTKQVQNLQDTISAADEQQRELLPDIKDAYQQARDLMPPESPQEGATAAAPKPESKTPRYGALRPVEGSGELQTRALSEGVEATAIAKDLTDNFGDLPEYQRLSIAEQAAAASDLVKSDYERAKAIAMGERQAPKNILPESVFVAVERKAIADSDVETLRDLATNSRLSTEATTMGQRIRTLGERDKESPVGAIAEVQKARADDLARRSDLQEAQKATVLDIRRSMRASASPVGAWQEFINTITCK